jgi:hypothetical protein
MRGRTEKGRQRTERSRLRAPPAQLLRTEDQGDPVLVRADSIGQVGDRWVAPFLDANRASLARLQMRAEVRTGGGVHVALHPGMRIGAVPLLSPSTRKVAAGLLVKPRFRWTAFGDVFQRTGFSVEPTLGAGPAVPGSAREVPAWILAAPVLRRLEAALKHERLGFTEIIEERASPRGRILWNPWTTRNVPSGRWHRFTCAFPEPQVDPVLLSNMRWTVRYLFDELARFSTDAPARTLLDRAARFEAHIGPGPAERPRAQEIARPHGFVGQAVESMLWVSERRGLGGGQSLDGLAWDLAVDRLWEEWVASFAADLAPRLGLIRQAHPRRPLRWTGSVDSMASLAPDVVLRSSARVVWIDAKYKAHVALLLRHGWSGLSDDVRAAHRADLHQALAYASLADVERVDTVLAYPALGDTLPAAEATLPSGRKRVRVVLASLPFGFRGPDDRERALERWRALLAA